MSRMNTSIVATGFAVLLSGMALSSASAADALSDKLLACADEADDTSRLRCFDAAVAGLRKTPSAPAAAAIAAAPAPQATSAAATVPPASAPAAAAAAASPEDKFGARGDLRPETHATVDEITGTVTEVGTKPHGELIITLDNGQVWAELSPSKVKVKQGDTVKIESGALGSFRLVAANNRSSKVSRIR
jgi:biotin carboxyl carrier protein